MFRGGLRLRRSAAQADRAACLAVAALTNALSYVRAISGNQSEYATSFKHPEAS